MVSGLPGPCLHDFVVCSRSALGTAANTDTKLLIDALFQKGRVLAQDGIDGLALASGPTTVRERSIDDGQRLAFQVAFAPVEEPSTLSVLVSGQFHGAFMSRAASFTVGDPALFRAGRSAQQRELTDAEGNRIKVAGQAEKK